MSVNTKKKLFIIFTTTLVALYNAGCSYVSDMIEGAITERASFSIVSSYDNGTNQLTVAWEETDSSSNFAGYEIYITMNVNDEYSGYEIIASKWLNNTDLELYTTTSYSYDVSNILNQSWPKGPGTYFCRVGIIHWDDQEEERTEENGYEVDENEEWIDNENNYNINSNISQISGSAIIEIY